MVAFGAMQAGPTAAATLLGYTARLRGIPLLDVAFCVSVGAGAYEARLTARTVGLAEFLVHGRVDGRAAGGVSGGVLKPASYVEHGRIAGAEYRLAIDYPAGDPVLREMVPKADPDRLPVASASLAGAVDGVSAITLEMLVASRTDGCQGSALVYDARQLRRLTTRTAGMEDLPRRGQSAFAGRALRCDTESVMLAGFFKDKAQGPQARPRYSKAWLAKLNGSAMAVPVRFTFDADALGDITVDLDNFSASECLKE